jgi:hypothetical protein
LALWQTRRGDSRAAGIEKSAPRESQNLEMILIEEVHGFCAKIPLHEEITQAHYVEFLDIVWRAYEVGLI